MAPRSQLSSYDDGRNGASNSNTVPVKKSSTQRRATARGAGHEKKLTKSTRRRPIRAPRNKNEGSTISATAISSPPVTDDNALVTSSALPAEESSDALNVALSGIPGNNSNAVMGSPYGGAIGGGMMGMYGSPYGYGMMGSPMMMGGAGPFSGLYQVLFGVQNIVFSLGQVVSILGMNQQAMQQVFDSISSMLDQAMVSYHELRALEALEKEQESEEQKKRRRRLKTIRWALVAGTSWLVYKLLRRLVTSSTSRRKRLRYGGVGNVSGGYGTPYSNGNSMMSYSPSTSYGGGYGTSSMMHGPSIHTGYGSGGLYGGGLYGGGGYNGGGGYF